MPKAVSAVGLIGKPWVLIGCLVVAACQDTSGPGQFEPKVGTAFTAPGALRNLALLTWTPDGNELVYEGVDYLLHGFRPSAGTDRTIDPRIRYRYERVWAGGMLCYLSEDVSSNPIVDSIECLDPAAGPPSSITDQAGGGLSAGPDTLLAYSVLGPRCMPQAGWSTCDSLFLYNMKTGSNEFVTLGTPEAVSPDGKQIFYSGVPCDIRTTDLNTCPHGVLDLATHQSTPISAGPVDDLPWLTRWDAAGIWRVVSVNAVSSSLVIRNFTQGTMRNLRELGKKTVWPSPALSGDNGTLAYWLQDPAGPSSLHVVDLATGEDREVAQVLTDLTGEIALTKDGSRIAYIVKNQGFWADIR
jgi:hypothetical protein